jgi:cytidylate kinase
LIGRIRVLTQGVVAMAKQVPYVITISRQLGSGGAHLGRALATELGIAYADRDILERAAASFQVRTEDLEARDESAPSFLESVFGPFALGVPEVACIPALDLPSYTELREAESEVIREIAARQSAVIVGRAGFHLLAHHPQHLSVFLHANLEFRSHRVEEVYGISRERALRVIEESDRARGRCMRELTGRPWTDALQYDVSLCTSTLGLMLAGRVLGAAARAHFRPS